MVEQDGADGDEDATGLDEPMNEEEEDEEVDEGDMEEGEEEEIEEFQSARICVDFFGQFYRFYCSPQFLLVP